MGGMIGNMVKIGFAGLIVGRTCKTLGQKELGEIVTAVTIMSCGVAIYQAFLPLGEGIGNFINDVGGLIEGIGGFFTQMKDFFF